MRVGRILGVAFFTMVSIFCWIFGCYVIFDSGMDVPNWVMIVGGAFVGILVISLYLILEEKIEKKYGAAILLFSILVCGFFLYSIAILLAAGFSTI